MSILGKFTKQPGDTQDYSISYVDWLAGMSDTGLSHTVTVDTGITLGSSTLSGGVVTVWLSGGTDGNTYKVTCTLTTTGGRVKQAEILVKVKET